MPSLAIKTPQTDKQCWNGVMFQWQVAVKQQKPSAYSPLTARLIKGLSGWDGFCGEGFEICLNIPSRCSYLGLRHPHPPTPPPHAWATGGCVSRFGIDSRGAAYGCTVKNISVVILVQWNDVGSKEICKTLLKMQPQTQMYENVLGGVVI